MTIPMLQAAQFITDFGDQAAVLPSALALLLGLFVLRRWHDAACWFFAVCGSFGSVLVLKLVFQACGSPLPDHLLRSPSGHTMASAVLYGGLFAIYGSKRRISVTLAVIVAVVVAATRLELHAHTLPEVIVGGGIGVAGVLALGLLLRAPPPRAGAVYRWLPVAMGLLPAILLHGNRSLAEATIHSWAVRYVSALLACHPPA